MKKISAGKLNELYKTREEREVVLQRMSNEEIDYLISTCNNIYGKIYYSKFKKKELPGDPIADLSVESINNLINSNPTSQELADAYVNALVKYKFYEDASYDYEEGSEEYENILVLTDSWSDISDNLEKLIMKAASDEGILAFGQSDIGTNKQIEPFMNKYGFYFRGGWWTKKDN